MQILNEQRILKYEVDMQDFKYLQVHVSDFTHT